MNRRLLPLAPLLALPLLLAACGGKPAGGFQMPPRPVTVAPAVQQDVPVYLDEIGTCTSPEVVSIVPQVTGKITEVFFKEGADVKKGDPLFTIDPRPYLAALEQAQAALLQDQAKLQLAKSQLDRSAKLVQGDYISPQDLDTLKTNASTAAALVQADQAAVDNAKLNVEYCHIVSPIDGRLGKRLVDVGNVVSANIGVASSASGTSTASSGALVNIQKVDRLYIDFTVAETDFPDVKGYFDKGPLSLVVTLPGRKDLSRKGALSFLDNTVQSGAGTVQLRGELANDDRALWPGQFVNVRLVLQTLTGAILVPAQALQISQQGPFVFVVKADSTAELRPVEVGQRQGGLVVLAKGVAPGEKIVVTGQLALAPGGKVAATDYKAPDAAPAQP